MAVGPTSSVVLTTTYLDDQVRLGRGSRGSSFVFTRGGASDDAGDVSKGQETLRNTKRRSGTCPSAAHSIAPASSPPGCLRPVCSHACSFEQDTVSVVTVNDLILRAEQGSVLSCLVEGSKASRLTGSKLHVPIHTHIHACAGLTVVCIVHTTYCTQVLQLTPLIVLSVQEWSRLDLQQPHQVVTSFCWQLLLDCGWLLPLYLRPALCSPRYWLLCLDFLALLYLGHFGAITSMVSMQCSILHGTALAPLCTVDRTNSKLATLVMLQHAGQLAATVV